MAWYIWYALLYLVRASRDQKEDEMRYLLDILFLAVSACACWVLWDVNSGQPTSVRVFVIVSFGVVCVLTDVYLHNMLDD